LSSEARSAKEEGKGEKKMGKKRIEFGLKFAREMAREFAGKFVAVINEKVVATGGNRIEVFKKAEKIASPSGKIGVFYFPTKKDMLTAL